MTINDARHCASLSFRASRVILVRISLWFGADGFDVVVEFDGDGVDIQGEFVVLIFW